MHLFSKLYDKAMLWAKHRHAAWYLGALSFAESSFFPVPPDVMLAPMALGQPPLAWRFALIATLASVIGGGAGYLIGAYAFELIEPWLHQLGYFSRYQLAVDWFNHWGIWVIFLAGFTPIPYKLFTIAAGVIAMAFLPFMLASLIGRGARFFMVAGLMRWGGARMDRMLRVYMDRIGWAMLAIVILAYVAYKLT